MMHCPKCGTTYTDETLRFCLADGSMLEQLDEQITVIQSAANKTENSVSGGQLRVEIPQFQPGKIYLPPQTAADNSPSLSKIFLVVGLFSTVLLIGIVGAGALIYFNKDSRTSNAATISNDLAKPTASPARDIETDKLREQIANLEKRINDQTSGNKVDSGVTPKIPTPPDQPSITNSPARVNSPGDGFLALRSLPDSDKGERLIQIPHGAAVSINGCLPQTRIGGKIGRWCRASYGSNSGWVFDAWLIY